MVNEEVRRPILISWSECLPYREFVPFAKKFFHAVPEGLLMQSPVEKQLRRIQSRLVV